MHDWQTFYDAKDYTEKLETACAESAWFSLPRRQAQVVPESRRSEGRRQTLETPGAHVEEVDPDG